jgi:Fe2+ transport system protein B
MNTAVKIKSCTRASASGKIAYNEERTKNKKQDILLLEKNEMPKEVSLSKENKKEINSLSNAQNSPKIAFNKKNKELVAEKVLNAQNRNMELLQSGLVKNFLGKSSISNENASKINDQQQENIQQMARDIEEIKSDYEDRIRSLNFLLEREKERSTKFSNQLQEVFKTLQKRLGMPFSTLGGNFEKFKSFFAENKRAYHRDQNLEI